MRGTKPRRYATIAEVADYLRVDHKTVRRRISAGDLTAYRAKGSRIIRVDLNEVDDTLMQVQPSARS